LVSHRNIRSLQLRSLHDFEKPEERTVPIVPSFHLSNLVNQLIDGHRDSHAFTKIARSIIIAACCMSQQTNRLPTDHNWILIIRKRKA
jgi:hypothetical protein